MDKLNPGHLEYYRSGMKRTEIPIREFVENTLAGAPTEAVFRIKVIELLAMLAHQQGAIGALDAFPLIKWGNVPDRMEITGAGVGIYPTK